jgi:uncharacterized DUF497 family protein
MASFEWDDAKNASNVEKHGIDFEDAIAIFEKPVLVLPSSRSGEVRWVAIGLTDDGTEIAVVHTLRGEAVRVISARRARTNERTAYRQANPI